MNLDSPLRVKALLRVDAGMAEEGAGMTNIKKYKTPPGSHPVFPHYLDSPFTCHRCQGLFVRVFCMDMYDSSCENGFWALRCLQCGELLDPLILQNRISNPQSAIPKGSDQINNMNAFK